MKARSMKLIANTVLILAIALGCGASAYSADTPPIARQCIRDLAKRFNVPTQEITVVEAKPTVWPDAGLGLPRPDEMNAQVLTPGFRIILEAKSTKYLYCTSSRKIKYGGPAEAWRGSALYSVPTSQPDGNGNEDLYQISLAGTNPTRLLSAISEIYPQADGSILATQRTSRSGFDLLYLAPGEIDKPQKLASGFAFGGVALSPDGREWAALTRSRLGSTWTLERARLGSNAKPQTLDLPDAPMSGRLVWEASRFVALMRYGGDRSAWFGYDFQNTTAGWQQLKAYSPPELADLMLDKSETLGAKVSTEDGKTFTEVQSIWFTGDAKPLARIDGFAYQGLARVLPSFALLWGQQGDDLKAYTVDINTGAVMLTVAGPAHAVKPFAAPPHGSPLK